VPSGWNSTIAEWQGLRLHEHPFGLLVGLVEAGGLDQLVGALGLADVEVGVLELLGADHAADHDGGDDERKPAEDRGLPVVRTPAAHPGCEVVRSLER
jgi:hypothetical protein